MSSHQKVIPLSDNNITMSSNNLHATEQPQEDYRIEDGIEGEEDENLIDDEQDIFKLAEVSWAVKFERFRAKLTYDYFKQSMRWFLESASIEFSFSVSLSYLLCKRIIVYSV